MRDSVTPKRGARARLGMRGGDGLCPRLTCATSPAAATEITPVLLLMVNMWGWGWSGVWCRME